MHKTGETRRCLVCQTEFYTPGWQIKTVKGGGMYCSNACKYDAMRGRELVSGTRAIRKDGYIEVKVGIHQRRLEHRVIVEQAIGRKLTTNEQVHHINGVKHDNRIENLQLLTNAEHQKLHDHLDVQHAPRTVTLVCVVCGKEYQTRPSRGTSSTCCSNACRLVHMRAGRKPKK